MGIEPRDALCLISPCMLMCVTPGFGCSSRGTGRSWIGQWISPANRPSAIDTHHIALYDPVRS